MTGDGENGNCVSYPPPKSPAALQKVVEAPGIMVHIQVSEGSEFSPYIFGLNNVKRAVVGPSESTDLSKQH